MLRQHAMQANFQLFPVPVSAHVAVSLSPTLDWRHSKNLQQVGLVSMSKSVRRTPKQLVLDLGHIWIYGYTIQNQQQQH